MALGGELAEDLFALRGDLDSDLASIFLVLAGFDELALSQSLDGGGHGAAGEADFGGDLIDCLGAFLLETAEDVEVGGAELIVSKEGALFGTEKRFGLGDEVTQLQGLRILCFHGCSLGQKELREKPS